VLLVIIWSWPVTALIRDEHWLSSHLQEPLNWLGLILTIVFTLEYSRLVGAESRTAGRIARQLHGLGYALGREFELAGRPIPHELHQFYNGQAPGRNGLRAVPDDSARAV